jgi:glycyl-tRNA synthetase
LRIKQNLVSVWRTHWLTNNIDEVEVPDIAPYAVLKASGHVDKFSDQIVELNGTEIRADHLVKEIYNHLNLNEDTVDSMTTVELEKVINDNIQFVISKYSTNGSQEKESNKTKELKVRTKSLMLGIKDGSTYLMRPELAQTIYPNFRRYFDYHGKLPFGIAQVGRSYRNEICPRAFERLRSFTQAEVEYFYDPSLPIHPEWPSVSSLIVPLLSSDSQQKGLFSTVNPESPEMTLADALDKGIIKDQITATFIGKVFKFVLDIGLKITLIRFRQHLPTEMAHYANDCWDLECFINNEKWLECVGIANRGDYDLKVHDRGNAFCLNRDRIHKTKLELDQSYIGKTYKNRAKEITAKFNECFANEILETKTVNIKLDDGFNVAIDTVHIRQKPYVVQETYYPHVIEPSFGIDRLFYAVLSQNYWIRQEKKPEPTDSFDDISQSQDKSESQDKSQNKDQSQDKSQDQSKDKSKGQSETSFDDIRQVLSLKPCLSPYDVSVLYLVNNPALVKLAQEITRDLSLNGIKIYNTGSGSIASASIGKKYVRSDRIGIPLVVTVDFDSLTDNRITIRNRDDMTQVRADIRTLASTLKARLCVLATDF